MSYDSDELSKLRRRVSDLEWRLNEHLEALNYAVDQRDRFALNSAWGIVKATAFIGSFIAANYIFDHWLNWKGWIAGALSVILAFIILAIMGKYIEKGETEDQGKLAGLPLWKPRDWDDND